MKKLVVIAGPTASGKTALSVKLAQQLKTEIISCDSRQLYSEMPIGTAAPTLEEMGGVPHHFIGSHSVKDEISAGKFEELAIKQITQLFQIHDLLILTGGSGLYLDAVLYGFDDMPKVNPESRKELNSIYADKGLIPLQKKLKELDPVYYLKVDKQNPVRIIRALEVIMSAGKPYSSFTRGAKADRPFETVKILLERPRDTLYERINRRVDEMIADGLEEEVRGLWCYRDMNALQTVGYREMFSYFAGEYSLAEAIDKIKMNSRRYAKRQITWFNRNDSYVRFDADDFDGIFNFVINKTKN